MRDTGNLSLALSGGAGGYITPLFDTEEDGCTYNRLIVDGRFTGVKLEILVAATDETDAFIDDVPQHLATYLQNPQIPTRQKAEILKALPHVRAVNAQDLLLHSLRGRYAWVCVLLHPTGECDCELRGLRLELPKYSFAEYFPEIYQGNDFFERYIAVFQSLFLDVEKQVDRVPELLDYRTTPDENVEYLASWLGIDNSRRLFSPAQLRHLIENIDIYQGAKGTKHALVKIITLLSGVRPRIVEHFEWMRPGLSTAQLAMNSSLYGDTRDHFCVILDLTKTALAITESDLEQIIEQYSPLDARFKVVYLKTNSHTDMHCYLDINSALSVPEVASVDGGAFGGHITIG
jgi:phage tail-like protein